MSGIIAVYGLVMAVLIAGSLNPLDDYSLYKYTLSRSPDLLCLYSFFYDTYYENHVLRS